MEERRLERPGLMLAGFLWMFLKVVFIAECSALLSSYENTLYLKLILILVNKKKTYLSYPDNR